MKCSGNRLSRRTFLTVGAVGGLGLSLTDLFTMQQARAEKKHYDFIEAKADSVIHIFLPGGMAQQESFDPKPFSPIEYRGEMKSIKTNTGEVISESLPKIATAGRQVRHHSLANARRGGSRTWHAQHVHGLQAQSRPALSVHGQCDQSRIRPAQQLAAVRLHSESAQRICRQRISEFLICAVQPWC